MVRFKNVLTLLFAFFFCPISSSTRIHDYRVHRVRMGREQRTLASRRITLDLGMKKGNVLDCQGLSLLTFNSLE
ncbi:hypothetical protein HDV63DRAFT_370281 [Trichoderma sp. SZMC 28014]